MGLVGRTGSGKSSLTLSLLRCISTEGSVYYDGIPTSAINLDALRSNVTIIPQIPELLSGTLRQNLDPFDQHDDAVLYDALRSAGLFSVQDEFEEARLTLDSAIASGGRNLSVGQRQILALARAIVRGSKLLILDEATSAIGNAIASGGGNLSVGQRQILALARAIVRGSKLLILDEATSAIDYKTDSAIQSSLRNELHNVTQIIVAHRLQTIIDADKIMVLDAGKLVEFGSPWELLQNEKGMLRALVDESGDKDAFTIESLEAGFKRNTSTDLIQQRAVESSREASQNSSPALFNACNSLSTPLLTLSLLLPLLQTPSPAKAPPLPFEDEEDF
ncbi:hypothetical protein AZE42_08496 [Rhizopogon vesiculosus]|uniref:ABC transporter domain-containing protein n=1 Tax=Rhizopogon vesiculosus TaxID=180088 RepID=A0A1J8R508_9AGAM|nr:hypothetical protein AZE42_08496 [Rhizopogon vesiculosus]